MVHMGWVRCKCTKHLPDKAFRTSFAGIRVEAIVQSTSGSNIVFEEEKPNSVRYNRSLLEGIGDENILTASLLQIPIEDECEYLKRKVMRVWCGDIWRRFNLKFYNSMIDEKAR